MAAVIDAQWTNLGGNDHEIDISTGENADPTFKLYDAYLRRQVYKLNHLFARVPATRLGRA